VVFIHIELHWERNIVLVNLFGAIEEDSGLELIIGNQRRSAIGLESANLEVAVWHLKFKELLMYLISRILNNNNKLRFIAIWRVELTVLLS